VSLKSSQGLKKRVVSPFSIFCVKSVGSERLDEFPLTLNIPASLGNTTFGRRELIVGAVFSNHDEVFADRPQMSLT
jgi:hypothetical protein